ncbi:MAG: hypothetical protein Ct9H300mP27_05250 [Chloroflexota bacterium]|nr:MAG: hypothetical protein Ct9H300mP27_05250 [Chloroflexota bacterium]
MKRGQNLIIDDTAGLEEVVGGYRENKKGIDAYARTMGYEPERSRKGFDTVEDAKAFVESFTPWDLFGPRDIGCRARSEAYLRISPAINSLQIGLTNGINKLTRATMDK